MLKIHILVVFLRKKETCLAEREQWWREWYLQTQEFFCTIYASYHIWNKLGNQFLQSLSTSNPPYQREPPGSCSCLFESRWIWRIGIQFLSSVTLAGVAVEWSLFFFFHWRRAIKIAHKLFWSKQVFMKVFGDKGRARWDGHWTAGNNRGFVLV